MAIKASRSDLVDFEGVRDEGRLSNDVVSDEENWDCRGDEFEKDDICNE